MLRFLHLPKHERCSVRIDWWGATAVIVALVPLLLVAEEGRDWGWGSAGAIACYVIGALGIIAFIFIEMAMKDDALIPLKLFRSSTFSMATIIGVFVGFGMFGAMLTLPLYLQLVLGSTPTESGPADAADDPRPDDLLDRQRPDHRAHRAATGSSRSSAPRSSPAGSST